MCSVYEIVDVSLVVAHGGLVPRKAPISIHYKLVLMDASLQWMEQGEFVGAGLDHR